MKIRQLKTEVLVIGGGAAGLRAALAAAEAGSKVMVVSKGPAGRSGITLAAAGGMQAPFHPADSVKQFFTDTIQCGYGLGDQNLAWLLASGACEAALDLERYGARFMRDEAGKVALGKFPGQSHPRNLFVKGGGIGIVSALAQACRKRENIAILDEFFVTGLVRGASTAKPQAAGVVGIDLRSGERTLIRSRSVVLAAGGCQWLWEVNDCPADATGEGLIHAYRAGAELVDMEMILFYPSVVVWPPSLKGAFVHYEFLAEAILDGNVYDKDGRAVLPKPLPVRDQAMRLMDRAIREGRAESHGGLIWYVGDSPKGNQAVKTKLNIAQYNYIKAHGVDPATDRIEVAPGAHYLMGGVFIDDRCRTSLDGLFATPECAGNFDGANRLAGSGITATQVFGNRSGVCAQEWAAQNDWVEVDAASLEEEEGRIACKIDRKESAAFPAGECEIQNLQARLRSAVQRYAGVSRDKIGLDLLAQIADETRRDIKNMQVPAAIVFNQALVDLLQLEAMCEVALLVAGSAQLRTESRGHHYRLDYPEQNDADWLHHICARQSGAHPRFDTKPVKTLGRDEIL